MTNDPSSQPDDDRTIFTDGSPLMPTALPAAEPVDEPTNHSMVAHYRLQVLLGEGGMGRVFQAEDTHLQRPAALKLMLPEFAAEPRAYQRFLREARIAASIKSDHIVTIYQVGHHGPMPFLAMELLHGEPLDRRLAREGRLPVREAMRIAREMALGLAAAHSRDLIHRDIKPANVYLEAPSGRVKLLDFGIARSSNDRQSLTGEGLIVGTPAYMSPEQARSGVEIDARCDLFSLGCVMYHMLMGHAPFLRTDVMSTLTALAVETPTPPGRLNAEVSPQLNALVMRLLEKSPDQRPPAAALVAQTLESLLSSATTVAIPASAAPSYRTEFDFDPTLPHDDDPSAPQKARRGPSRWLYAGIAGGLMLIFGGGYWLYRIATSEEPPIVAVVEPEPNEKPTRIKPIPKAQPKNGIPHDEWFAQIRELPGEERADAVRKRMHQLHGGLIGQWDAVFENGEVVELTIDGTGISDITPLQALPKLRILRANADRNNTGKIQSLEALRGLPLEEIQLAQHRNITDLSPVVNMPLRSLHLYAVNITDLRPLAMVRSLEELVLGATSLTDLTPLRGLRLRAISLNDTPVTEIEPLRGHPLKFISIAGTNLQSIAPLTGITTIERLVIYNTRVTDFTPIRDSKSLTNLQGYQSSARNEEVIRSLPNLNGLNTTTATKYFKEIDDTLNEIDEWKKRLDSQSPKEQAMTCCTFLRKLNPDFEDTTFAYRVEEGRIVEVTLPVKNISDIRPISALSSLRKLNCIGAGTKWPRLVDLTPLRNLPLEELTIPTSSEQTYPELREIASLKRINGTPVNEFFRASR